MQSLDLAIARFLFPDHYPPRTEFTGARKCGILVIAIASALAFAIFNP